VYSESKPHSLGRKYLPAAVIPIVLVLVPYVAEPYWVFLLSLALCYGLLAVSLDLQWGFTGLINFGAAAAFGIGAYAYALLSSWWHITSLWVLLPCAGILGAVYAIAVGLPAFLARSLPLYYALLTMAASLLLGQIAVTASFTGGSDGINNLPAPDLALPGMAPIIITDPRQAYFVVLGIAALSFIACVWLVRSPFGRVLSAIRHDENRTQALGYPIVRFKVMIAAASGAMAALGGALFGAVNASINPTLFALTLSLSAFIWVAVGGHGTLWGPFLAALGLNLAEAYMSKVNSDLYLVAIALIFIVVVLFLPQGIAGLTRDRLRRSPSRTRESVSNFKSMDDAR